MEVLRSAAILLKPGKYISIESGPMAVSKPKIRIRSPLFWVVVVFMKAQIYETNYECPPFLNSWIFDLI
jgi:hypothetical protein